MSKKVVGGLLSSIVILSAVVLGWQKRYDIYDYYNLRNYQPPAVITQLANDNTLTDYGRRLFYVNQPQLFSREAFNQQCDHYEQTIVLGCYTGHSIFIFDIDDEKLSGVEQVTAAHEILHVAYDRLSNSERQKIDALTAALFESVNDQRLNGLIASYEKQDPALIPNELHSILATELDDIGSELEEYYSRYFKNRSRVVAYAHSYKTVFENLKTQVANYDADLSLRRTEIENIEGALSIKEQQISNQKNQMDALMASGDIATYNNQVASYNQKVNDYNNEIARLKLLINEFNSIVEARNSIIVEQQNLAKSIDSRPQAINGE